MPYPRTDWTNLVPPPISGDNLDKMEAGIYHSLAHSGGIRNTAEFLDENPGSTTGGLDEAVADLGGSPGIIFAAPHNHPINVNTTIPATVHLIASRGTTFTVANGITFTIDGPYEAGLYRTFILVGTGSVSFGAGAVKEAHPEWWYSGAGSWDTAIQAALDSGAGKTLLVDRVYSYDTRLDVPIDVTFSGLGNQSVLSYTGAAEAVAMRFNAVNDFVQWRSIIEKMKIVSDTGTVGILMRNVYEAIVEKVLITSASEPVDVGFSTAGIQLDANGIDGSEFCNRIHQCTIRENTGAGILFSGANHHNQDVISENRILGNLTYGIHAQKRVAGLVITGNDCEGNTIAEMIFENGAFAVTIQGNWLENNGQAADGIRLVGTGRFYAMDIRANRIVSNHVASTGTAFLITGTHADGYTAIIFRGNVVAGYNHGVNFNSKKYYACDFSGNDYIGVTTIYPSGVDYASSGILMERLSNASVWNPGNMVNDGDVVSTTVTVAGAVTGNPASASLSTIGANDVLISAHVSAADTVTVILMNKTGGGKDIANGTLVVEVRKHYRK